jgi:hypothetical protein
LRVFTLAFALQLRKNHGKPQSGLRKTSVRVQYTYYQNTHTLQTPHKNTHYKTNTHTHTHYKTIQKYKRLCVYTCWMAYIPTFCSIIDWPTERQFDTIVRKIRVGVSHLLSVQQPGYRSQQCHWLRAGISGVRTPVATHFSLLQDPRPALRSTQTTRWGPEFLPGCQSTGA